MNWKIVIAILAAIVLVAVGLGALGVWLVVSDLTDDLRHTAGVEKALADHEAELRAVPGLTSLGTHDSAAEAPHIIVTVRKITPAVRAAVPTTLDGYRVDLEEYVPPTSPPTLVGEVAEVRAATTAQAAQGFAGALVVDGDFYSAGYGDASGKPRKLTVLMPAGVTVWRPMGEGKDFIALAEIRAGDTVRVTLTEAPAKGARRATAADVEVY